MPDPAPDADLWIAEPLHFLPAMTCLHTDSAMWGGGEKSDQARSGDWLKYPTLVRLTLPGNLIFRDSFPVESELLFGVFATALTSALFHTAS